MQLERKDIYFDKEHWLNLVKMRIAQSLPYLLNFGMLLLNFASQVKSMRKIFLILMCLGIIGCDDLEEEKPAQTTVDTTAFTQNLSPLREQVTLLPEAREITSNWLAYITAESEIENFENYTVEDVISNATPIAEIMKSLRETPPAALKATAVEARLSVLYTKAKVLQQKAGKRTVDPAEVAALAEELPIEFNNFKIQINELFLKTLEDFEEELDLYDPEANFPQDPIDTKTQ